MQANSNIFITPEELQKLRDDSNVTVAAINFNYSGDNWDKTFQKERLPHARYVNIAQIAEKIEGLKNMLPTKERFVELLQEIKVSNTTTVVCYADDNMIGACRGYWMFKSYGWKNIYILDRLFGEYKSGGFPVEDGEPKHLKMKLKPQSLEVTFTKDYLTELKDIEGIVQDDNTNIQLLDARDSSVHNAGHIPKAKNIFWKDFMTENGSFKSKADLEKVFKDNNVDLSKPIRTSCQTGMSATIHYIAAQTLGAQDLKNYDGSFTEWSKDPSHKVIKKE